MQSEPETLILDRAATASAQPGLRATIRALVGRLGTPDLAAPLALGHYHAASVDWEAGPRETPAEEDEAVPARHAKALRALRRANAHAAYASVEEGTHAAALDAALAVIETDYAALEKRCAAQAEALKRLRLYAADPETRALAAKGLDGCPEILADHRVVDRGQTRVGAYHA